MISSYQYNTAIAILNSLEDPDLDDLIDQLEDLMDETASLEEAALLVHRVTMQPGDGVYVGLKIFEHLVANGWTPPESLALEG